MNTESIKTRLEKLTDWHTAEQDRVPNEYARAWHMEQAKLLHDVITEHDALRAALVITREYVAIELSNERLRFTGYGHLSNTHTIQADLAMLDAIMKGDET